MVISPTLNAVSGWAARYVATCRYSCTGAQPAGRVVGRGGCGVGGVGWSGNGHRASRVTGPRAARGDARAVQCGARAGDGPSGRWCRDLFVRRRDGAGRYCSAVGCSACVGLAVVACRGGGLGDGGGGRGRVDVAGWWCGDDSWAGHDHGQQGFRHGGVDLKGDCVPGCVIGPGGGDREAAESVRADGDLGGGVVDAVADYAVVEPGVAAPGEAVRERVQHGGQPVFGDGVYTEVGDVVFDGAGWCGEGEQVHAIAVPGRQMQRCFGEVLSGGRSRAIVHGLSSIRW